MAIVESLVAPVASSSSSIQKSRIDARPTLPVSVADSSHWDRAAARRDEIAERICQRFEDRGITAWVRKSQPGEYPFVVQVDSWLPVEESDRSATIDRSSLVITISVDPYRESPIIYKVDLRRHAKHHCHEFWAIQEHEIDELVTYMLDGGRRPQFFAPRVPLLLRVMGAFIPFVGRAPRNKLIQDARPRFWTIPTGVLLGSLIAAAIMAISAQEDAAELFAQGYYGDPSTEYWWAMLVAIVGVVSSIVLVHRRTVVQSIPKQSLRCPRREFRVDSWHVSVPGAGVNFDDFKRRIYAVAKSDEAGIEWALETHQNATPRGFEERERLVLSKGQATLHVHVYAFEGNAFVGWDSHLNWNRWAEGDTTSVRVSGSRAVEYKGLCVGVHLPTDFDLIECDVLTETTHQRIADEIKTFLKEREIEADLDFKIIRGDRARALEVGKDEAKPSRARMKAT